eukprot:GHRR01008281.1.p1 GENE.GHRR01008281.1~~GHRR01008281.1.p1  ORF type:complete len:179 (+),score=59.44 GHRR01008281.1:445-981(+)
MPVSNGTSATSPILRCTPIARHKMIIGRHETMPDKLWRYRGVLLVTSVPLLVVLLMISFLFPSHAPVKDIHTSIDSIHHYRTTQQQAGNTDRISSSGTDKYVYNIVLDAGSTGSRIHIFKFKQAGAQLQLISDGFHQLKPGLSAYSDDPSKGAQSLKPLLQEAMQAVPAAQQVCLELA